MMEKDIQTLPFGGSVGIFEGQYFRFPYRFFNNWFKEKGHEYSDFDAFLVILSKVNYADLPVKVGAEKRNCRRGESFRSLTTWSNSFQWNVSKTRRFLMKLKDMGILEVENVVYTTRIRIINYDYFVGVKPLDKEGSYEASFEEFWKNYHKIIDMRPTDKAAAARLWQMLDSVEKRLATENIIKYYYNLGNTRYCVKALTYLRNKKFNDEFYN